MSYKYAIFTSYTISLCSVPINNTSATLQFDVCELVPSYA